MASGWKTQLERILGSAIRAGLLSALRNLVGRSPTSGRRSSGTPRTRTRRRSTRAGSTRSGTTQPGTGRPSTARSSTGARPGPARSGASARSGSSAGRRVLDDFPGVPEMEYSPRDDGLPDPGEIVWSWVPYEEDRTQGKDRPVLIIGRDGERLLGLMLTSKDHDRDEQQEARYGRHWIDIGSGDWDPQRRPSEVRVDRVLRVDPNTVRREGAVLGRSRFDQVAAELRRVKRR